MKILGVDEAGRGPVLGPLVMGAVCAEESQFEKLRELGVRDSKALTPKARARIFDRLAVEFQIDHEIVTPASINGVGANLNNLEYDALSSLLVRLRPDQLIVDAFMTPHRLAKQIVRDFPNVTVIAEWKADENFPLVSAASIVAKVIRDRHIDELKPTYGDIGSGYPGDPKTRRWLRSQILKNRLARTSVPSFVRINWGTLRRLETETPPEQPEKK